jgi:arginine/lysine/ornithine decarboxylase
LKDKSGVRIAKMLRESYGIEAEMAMPSYLLLISTAADTKEDHDRLVKALYEIDGEYGYEAEDGLCYETIKPLVRMKPSEAFGAAYRKLALKEAEGLVSAGPVIAYPPGRVLLAPGEEVTKEICSRIGALYESGVSIRGLDKDMRIKLL